MRSGEPDRPEGRVRAHRAIVRNEPLLLAHGRYERVGENRNILVASLETLGALARRVAELDVGAALPARAPFRAPLTRRQPACDQRRLGVLGDLLEPQPRVGAMAAWLSARTLSAIVLIPSSSRSPQRAAHAPRARPRPRSSGSVATLPSAATLHVGEYTWTPATQASRPSSRIPTYRPVASIRAVNHVPG